MFVYVVYLRFITFCFLFVLCSGTFYLGATQDQTTSRANTLQDDADDIQRQLDNEARDRLKYGRKSPRQRMKRKRRTKLFTKPRVSFEQTKDWSYKEQAKWHQWAPSCGGRSQSPVDLPYNGLIVARGARRLLLKNYDDKPESLVLSNDGKRVVLYGKWPSGRHPYIYGGAAHSRRYLFHSITFHWPSEHTIGSLQYPLESQVMHVAAEYRTMETAINASVRDPLALLAVSSLYMYGNHTQQGLEDVIKAAIRSRMMERIKLEPVPLSHFSPPLSEYACYQGSLTTPPCTEAVLWLVRGRTLSVTREMVAMLQTLTADHSSRAVQPMNDRKAYYFKV